MASRAQLDTEADSILRADPAGSYYQGFVKMTRPVTCPQAKAKIRAQHQAAYDKAGAIYQAMPKDERRKLSQRYKSDRKLGTIYAKSWAQWLLIELSKSHGLSLQ